MPTATNLEPTPRQPSDTGVSSEHGNTTVKEKSPKIKSPKQEKKKAKKKKEEEEEVSGVGERLRIVTAEVPLRNISYIQATRGARFSIRVHKNHPAFQQTSHHIGYKIELDGNLSGMYQEKDGLTASTTWTANHSYFGKIDGNQLLYGGYQWQPLIRVDDNQYTPSEQRVLKANADKYGLIRVHFYRLNDDEWSPFHPENHVLPPRELMQGRCGVSRSALGERRISLSVGYTPLNFEPRFAGLKREVKYQDGNEYLPFATFEFRYRTKMVLMRENIMGSEASQSGTGGSQAAGNGAPSATGARG
ncbi:hypothetical protein F4780DRAFT_785467 [Xylariomycetidae sp. FL0641]|nr:hypothetical protein F4780DRAFT_785467 [Xylariomycetidae sp. FL0641]